MMKRKITQSYKSDLSLFFLWFRKYLLFSLYSAYSFSIFFDIIKNDKVVKDYAKYAQTIHNNIIVTTSSQIPANENTTTFAIQFRQLSVFPLLANIGDQELKIMHYI